MFDCESENMNNTNTTTSNSQNYQGNISTINSQAISLIKDLNNFNQNAIDKNLNINQQIINTTKLLSVRSMSTPNKQLVNKQHSKQHQIIEDDVNSSGGGGMNEDDDSGSQRNNTSLIMSNNQNLEDDDNDVLQVNCNSIVASLHKKKFGSGGKGRCINLENKWLTPIEFEQYCGKGNCRDWKRTIKCGGQQLLTLLDNNILLCHAVSCSCSVCSNDSNVVGPIRPFLRYRRRKRDEIMAQKAYQKFLSLKPPSLITTTTNNNDFDRIHNHTNFLLNNINNTCNLVNSSSNGNGGGGNINHVKNDYSSVDDALSTISSTNSDYNNMDNNNNNNNTNNQEDSYQNHNISENNGQGMDYNDKNENFSYNLKISNSVKEMQKLESEQWNLLEKAADILIIQSQNLKNLIKQAQNQSKMTKKCLINDLKKTNYQHDDFDDSDINGEDDDGNELSYNNNNDNDHDDNNNSHYHHHHHHHQIASSNNNNNSNSIRKKRKKSTNNKHYNAYD